jgi:hypothetical protein
MPSCPETLPVDMVERPIIDQLEDELARLVEKHPEILTTATMLRKEQISLIKQWSNERQKLSSQCTKVLQDAVKSSCDDERLKSLHDEAGERLRDFDLSIIEQSFPNLVEKQLNTLIQAGLIILRGDDPKYDRRVIRMLIINHL